MYRELNEIILNLKTAKTVGEERSLINEAEKFLENIHCCSHEKRKVQSLISTYHLGSTLSASVVSDGLEPLLNCLRLTNGITMTQNPEIMKEFLEEDDTKATIHPPTPFEQGLKELWEGYEKISNTNLNSTQKKALESIYSALQTLQKKEKKKSLQ